MHHSVPFNKQDTRLFFFWSTCLLPIRALHPIVRVVARHVVRNPKTQTALKILFLLPLWLANQAWPHKLSWSAADPSSNGIFGISLSLSGPALRCQGRSVEIWRGQDHRRGRVIHWKKSRKIHTGPCFLIKPSYSQSNPSFGYFTWGLPLLLPAAIYDPPIPPFETTQKSPVPLEILLFLLQSPVPFEILLFLLQSTKAFKLSLFSSFFPDLSLHLISLIFH